MKRKMECFWIVYKTPVHFSLLLYNILNISAGAASFPSDILNLNRFSPSPILQEIEKL